MEQFEQKPVPADIQTQVGTLSSLATTEKGSLVGAVNEVNGNISKILKYDNLIVTTNENGYFNIDGYNDKYVISIVSRYIDDYFIVIRPSSTAGRYICFVFTSSFVSVKNAQFNVRVFYTEQ